MKGFSGFGNSPAKMYGKKSPAKKELVGDQHNLPEELKAKIEAAPGKMYGEKSPMKQEGPIDKKQLKLQKGEMKGTYIYGRGYDDEEMGKYSLNKSERINDLEDRAEFARSDAEEAEGAKKKQHLANAKKLQHEADIIRNRKSPSKMHGKKSPAKAKQPTDPAKKGKRSKINPTDVPTRMEMPRTTPNPDSKGKNKLSPFKPSIPNNMKEKIEKYNKGKKKKNYEGFPKGAQPANKPTPVKMYGKKKK